MDSIKKIFAENDKKLEVLPQEAPPLKQNLSQDDIQIYEKTKFVPVVDGVDTKVPWFQVRAEYLSDSTSSLTVLAKKYRLEPKDVIERARKEKWKETRTGIYQTADKLVETKILEDLVVVKLRQLQEARYVGKKAMKTIRKMKNPLSDKDALAYWKEAREAEREILGMNKKDPKIVNIITQQQQIIDKYRRKKDGFTEAVTIGDGAEAETIDKED